MELEHILAGVEPSPSRPVVVLTGAGVSAASGIPTFRGPEGYWTVGSRVYHPQELATNAAFRAMPRDVWRWYLHRKGVCNAAAPNPAHEAIVALERRFGDAFHLITQNVDGLHERAGTSKPRMSEIHGSIDWMRDLSSGERVRIPAGATVDDVTGYRPHILWFDEYYDEDNYRADTAMGAASRASVLVISGTSGAAALPWHATEAAVRVGAAVVDISPEDNPFRAIASRYARGVVVEATAVDGLARVAAALGVR